MEFFNFFVKENGEDLLFRMIVTHMQCCFMSPAKYNRWTVSLLGKKCAERILICEKERTKPTETSGQLISQIFVYNMKKITQLFQKSCSETN